MTSAISVYGLAVVVQPIERAGEITLDLEEIALAKRFQGSIHEKQTASARRAFLDSPEHRVLCKSVRELCSVKNRLDCYESEKASGRLGDDDQLKAMYGPERIILRL